MSTTLRIDTALHQRILGLTQATQRDADMQATQSGLNWHDVRAWMLARASEKVLQTPQVKSLDEMKLDYKWTIK